MAFVIKITTMHGIEFLSFTLCDVLYVRHGFRVGIDTILHSCITVKEYSVSAYLEWLSNDGNHHHDSTAPPKI
jgi:hypothetical protein